MAHIDPLPPLLVQSGRHRPEGVTDDRILRELQPVFRGVHTADRDALMVSDRMQALRLSVGAEPVWFGLSAGIAIGAPIQSDTAPLEMCSLTSGRHRCREGVRMRRRTLADSDVVETEWGLATSATRTAVELATRGRSALDIARVDQVMRVGGISVGTLMAELERFPGMRGIRRARSILTELDPRAESVPETIVRVQLVRLGLPPPTPQLNVFDGQGFFVARLDLGWEQAKVGLEYDGEYHLGPEQHSWDLGRHNRLRGLGWKVFQVDKRLARTPLAIHDLVAPHVRPGWAPRRG
jgi:hypothetical protein